MTAFPASKPGKHECDPEMCVCREFRDGHPMSLLYAANENLHACPDTGCVNAHGIENRVDFHTARAQAGHHPIPDAVICPFHPSVCIGTKAWNGTCGWCGMTAEKARALRADSLRRPIEEAEQILRSRKIAMELKTSRTVKPPKLPEGVDLPDWDMSMSQMTTAQVRQAADWMRENGWAAYVRGPVDQHWGSPGGPTGPGALLAARNRPARAGHAAGYLAGRATGTLLGRAYLLFRRVFKVGK